MGSDADDAARWNARYAGHPPTFEPHPLVSEALAAGPPDGPVLELACGRSGSALALARHGYRVLAVDVSDVALRQLRAEARRRGLAARVWCVQADLRTFVPARGAFALVLATLFWDPGAYRLARQAVAPGGLLAWEALALTEDGRTRYRARPGELTAALDESWDVLSRDLDRAEAGPERRTTRVLARARSSVRSPGR
ncbi:class I SAM-dependent methyltransferase [Saccharomonospora azurea]|uniref:class I SAM-dependent methyltransferase n=1 Tax=Saccharomonospora azurea TaxID=40988 RepID=UPI003D91867A